MRWDEICGKCRTIRINGSVRTTVVALFVLLTATGCSFLQAEQGRQPSSAPSSSAAGAAGGHPAIVLSATSGAPGQDVTVVATLHAAGNQVAGTQNDLSFDGASVSLGAGGKPSCRVNGAIGKGATAFSFRPSGCQGAACSTLRALVLAMDNTDPIPDGATLYTCTVHISPSARPGQYHLKLEGVILSTPSGQKVANATGADGVLTVSAPH